MNIAVVGNRKGWTYEDVEKGLDNTLVTKEDTLISGGAEGVDAFAQEYAKRHGNRILIIYPDLSKPSPDCYYKRNGKIAEECDAIIVFNKDNRKSGSFNTMDQAKRLNKNIILIT
jgi:predicted Rossmann fold nucleotide-binding protein DprA/Smf involved in DNA uptake